MRLLLALGVVLLALPCPVAAAPGRTFIQLRQPTWSPSGEQIAYVRWVQRGLDRGYPIAGTEGAVWVANADGSRAHALTGRRPVPRSLAWAPDGHAIVFTGGGHIWTVDVRSRALADLGGGSNASWSPDGTRIAFLEVRATGGEIDVMPAGGGMFTRVFAYGGTPGVSGRPLRWSPDGRYVLAPEGGSLFPVDGSTEPIPTDTVGWSRDGTRRLTSAHTVVDDVTRRTTRVPAFIRPQLSPDGKGLAGSTPSGRVRVTAVGASAVATAPGGDSTYDAVTWSPLGRIAYVGSGRCGPRSQIDAVDRNGGRFRVLERSC